MLLNYGDFISNRFKVFGFVNIMVLLKIKGVLR